MHLWALGIGHCGGWDGGRSCSCIAVCSAQHESCMLRSVRTGYAEIGGGSAASAGAELPGVKSRSNTFINM